MSEPYSSSPYSIDPGAASSQSYSRNANIMGTSVDKLFEWFDKSDAFVRFRAENASASYRENADRIFPKQARTQAQPQPVTPKLPRVPEITLAPTQPGVSTHPSSLAEPGVQAQPATQAQPTAQAQTATQAQHTAQAQTATQAQHTAQAQPATHALHTAQAQTATQAQHTAQAQPTTQALPTAQAQPTTQALPTAQAQPTTQALPTTAQALPTTAQATTQALPTAQAQLVTAVQPGISVQPIKPAQPISIISTIDDSSLKRIETATVALTSGVDALGDSLYQSSIDAQTRNQALLNGIEHAFDRFSDKISTDISDALNSNNKIATKMLGDALWQSSNDVQARNQALLDGIEVIFNRVSSNISSGISAALDSNNNLAADLALTIKRFDEISLEQSNKTTELITHLMSDIAAQMRSTMNESAQAISESINSANSTTAVLVGQLTERTDKLVAEYEHYFNTIERNTTTIMSDMDSMVSNTIISLSEQMNGAMSSFSESMNSALEWFETGAERMIGQFDEQSRDIGLYAREINQDISVLSSNLRESVIVFNKGLNDSVNNTFREIDDGISDLTMRFANTLEAIQDTVDAMPVR